MAQEGTQDHWLQVGIDVALLESPLSHVLKVSIYINIYIYIY